MQSDTNMRREGTNPTGATAEKMKTIPTSVLIQLYNAGFRKLVPMLLDSKRANVYDHLIIDEQKVNLFASFTKNPNFWTEQRLHNKAYLFCNVATTFGLTNLKDSKGRPLYL